MRDNPINKFLRITNFSISQFKTGRIVGSFLPFKRGSQNGGPKDVVYKLTCLNHGKAYIGETERFLTKRVQEHSDCVSNFNTVASPLAEHALVHNCNFDFENVEILDSDTNWQKLRLKEAYHIRRNGGTDTLLNRDLGLDLDICWLNVK